METWIIAYLLSDKIVYKNMHRDTKAKEDMKLVMQTLKKQDFWIFFIGKTAIYIFILPLEKNKKLFK